MAQGSRKPYLTGLSIELTALVALLLGIYTPKFNDAASAIIQQLYLALFVIMIAALISVVYREYLLFPNFKVLALGGIFPAYMTLYSLFDDSQILSLIGSSERHLGAITYLICYGFYYVGLLLKLNRSWALTRILIIISSLEVLRVVNNYLIHRDISRTSIFGNTNAESFFLCLLFVGIVVYSLEIEIRKQIKIVIASLTLSMAILILVLIGSLQGQLSFTITIFLYIVYKVSKPCLNFPIALSLFFFGTFASFTSFVLLRKIPTPQIVNIDSFYERLEIYKSSFFGLKQMGFFGVGIDQYSQFYYRYNRSDNFKLVDNAHSIPLQLIVTLGFIGILFWSVIFILALKKSPLNLDLEYKVMYFSVSSYVLTGFVGIQVVAIEFFVYLFLGGLMATNVKIRKTTNSSFSKRFQIGVLAALIIATSSQLFSYIKITNLVTQMSISLEKYRETSDVFGGKLGGIYDLDLLLQTGRISIYAKDKRLGLLVMQRMLKLDDNDQRSIAFTLELGNYWGDTQLLNLGKNLNISAKGSDPYEE